jgi:SET domain-containing protein
MLRFWQYEDMGLGTYFWRLEDYLGAGEPPEGRASIVDATIRHNIGHYINHCCDPNCKVRSRSDSARMWRRERRSEGGGRPLWNQGVHWQLLQGRACA